MAGGPILFSHAPYLGHCSHVAGVAWGTTPVPSSSAKPIPLGRIYSPHPTAPEEGHALLVVTRHKGWKIATLCRQTICRRFTHCGSSCERANPALPRGRSAPVGVSGERCLGGASQASVDVTRAKPVLLRISAGSGADMKIEPSGSEGAHRNTHGPSLVRCADAEDGLHLRPVRPYALSVVAVLAVGCNTTPVPSSSALPIPAERVYAPEFTKAQTGFALVVVTRDKGLKAKDCTARLFVDGTRVADMRPSDRSDCSSRKGRPSSASAPTAALAAVRTRLRSPSRARSRCCCASRSAAARA